MLVEFHHAVDGDGVGGCGELLLHNKMKSVGFLLVAVWIGIGFLEEGRRGCGEFWGGGSGGGGGGRLTEGLAICERWLLVIDE